MLIFDQLSLNCNGSFHRIPQARQIGLHDDAYYSEPDGSIISS